MCIEAAVNKFLGCLTAQEIQEYFISRSKETVIFIISIRHSFIRNALLNIRYTYRMDIQAINFSWIKL